MTHKTVIYKYGTGNPVEPNGSSDVRDGIDNLQSFDVFMNAEEDTYNQRDGEVVQTVAGAIRSSGFKPGIGDFTTGFTVMPGQRNYAWYDPVSKNWYSWLGNIPGSGYVVSPATNPVGDADWKPVTDEILRNELAIKTIHTFGGAVSPADSTSAFNASNGTPIQIPDGVYIGSPMAFTKMGMAGRANSTVKQVAASGNFLAFSTPTGGGLSNLKIESNKGGSTTAPGHQIAAVDGGSYTLENLDFDTEGTGFAALLYPNLQASIKRILVRGIRGRHLTSTLNGQNGCVLLVKSECSIVDGATARDYGQFGVVELKDDATHNIVSNVISENCDSTVYLGTETAASPSMNIVTGIVAKGSRSTGVNIGYGSYNVVQGVVADFTNSEATNPQGVVTFGNGNVSDNIMYLGVDGTTPIGGATQIAYPTRHRGTARNNYTSLFAHHTSDHVVSFEDTTTRNFVEIKHPGERSDIFVPSVTISDRATINGTSDSNVVHCPPLGQYFGTMSGRFEWRIKDMTPPGSTLFSGDVFRFTNSGTAGMAVGGGTTAQLKLFNSDGTFRTLSLGSSQSIRIDTGSGDYLQFGPTSLIPNATNTYALGSASNAWSGGFTQTAFTVTSDERMKTAPLEITDAMLDAAAEVDWVQYQYLDRVEEKGLDGARWHFGAVAQRFVEAFARHGLDAHRFAFICFDEWDDQHEPVMAFRENAETGEQEEYDTGEVKLVQSAGNRYGIRYEEALSLEAALQRRNYQRLLARIEALEVK